MPAPTFRSSTEDHFFKMPGWFVWCGSIVRDKEGTYHLFVSRWPKEYGHDGWVTHSEIVRAESKTLDSPFTFQEIILGARDEGYWDASNAHNVTVQKFDDQYYLYYTGNYGNGEYWDHRNHQRIGVATADHPAGPWTRPDQPLLELRPDNWDGLIHANPVATRMPDGRFLLMYKGAAIGPPPFGGDVRHGVAFSDWPTGPFVPHPIPIFDVPGERFPYEDPGLWVEDDVIYCLLKTMDARFSPTGKMGTLLFHSRNGIDWTPSDPHFVVGREIQMTDERTLSFERLERPQVFIDDDGTRVLLLAAQPKPIGTSATDSHIVGPSGLPHDIPESYSVRLFWEKKGS